MDLREIKDLEKEVIALRREFHMYPELGFQEHETAQRIEQYLQALGLSVRRVAGTGIESVIWGGRPGKTVLLRADMDALPIREETGLPYASRNDGVMHACSHDIQAIYAGCEEPRRCPSWQ